MPVAAPGLVRFGEFALDLQRCALRRGEDPIEIRPRAFDVLRYLVEHRDRVIGKDELIEAIWPGQAVTDDALAQCVRSVRQALSDRDQRIIRTVRRRGYLFSLEPTEASSPVPEPGPGSQDIQYCPFVALESENHVPLPDEPAWPQFIAEIEAFLQEG
jgi:DNA-binding winged helix-turn-helix (wHTH) protein